MAHFRRPCFSENKASVYYFSQTNMLFLSRAGNASLWLLYGCTQKGNSGSTYCTVLYVYISLNFPSLSVSLSVAISLRVLKNNFLVVWMKMEIEILAFHDSKYNNSIVFLYKAHAIALMLTVTLSLTQTDVIKRHFICSQNPACLPTTILWFSQAVFFSFHQRCWKRKNCTKINQQ